MEVIILPSIEDCANLGARKVSDLVNSKSNAVLGLATGSTPIPVYEELVRLHNESGLSFSKVKSFNLDEYIGLAPDHSCSYRYFMKEHLFNLIDIKQDFTYVPNGMVDDISEECSKYESAIKKCGGIDLQILGIGSDGHIGFNEPGSSLSSRTRIKTLASETIRDNARFFDDEDEVPRHCITMGVGTILDAKSVLLFAFGESKADIVAKSIEGPITSMIPASVLQMHQNVTVLLDDKAASKLSRRDYYRDVYSNKPDSY